MCDYVTFFNYTYKNFTELKKYLQNTQLTASLSRDARIGERIDLRRNNNMNLHYKCWYGPVKTDLIAANVKRVQEIQR